MRFLEFCGRYQFIFLFIFQYPFLSFNSIPSFFISSYPISYFSASSFISSYSSSSQLHLLFFSVFAREFLHVLYISSVHVITHMSAIPSTRTDPSRPPGQYFDVCFDVLRPVLGCNSPPSVPLRGKRTLEGFPTRARPAASALLTSIFFFHGGLRLWMPLTSFAFFEVEGKFWMKYYFEAPFRWFPHRLHISHISIWRL